jgi:hypothetical protein
MADQRLANSGPLAPNEAAREKADRPLQMVICHGRSA